MADLASNSINADKNLDQSNYATEGKFKYVECHNCGSVPCSDNCSCKCHINPCDDCNSRECDIFACTCNCHSPTPVGVIPPSGLKSKENSPSKLKKTVKKVSSNDVASREETSPDKGKSELKTNAKKKTSMLTSMMMPPKDDIKINENNKRQSKFSAMLRPEKYRGEEELMNESGAVNQSDLTRTFIRDKDGKTIIRFRSKSREKKSKRANEEKMSHEDERLADERKRKFSLGAKLKAQFDRVKLKDLKTPEKLENHVEEKFRREKNEITKKMEELTRQIKAENYSEGNKLAMNIFEDFEKQESWQSYTTLLFADLSKVEADKKNEASITSKLTKVATLKK